jgi:DNA-binding transcriptional MerR regulator
LKLLSPRDVARRLNLSTSRVVQLDREGLLKARRDSAGRRFYEQEAVERFARSRVTKPGIRVAGDR